jgi:acetyltransferase-like isoleucine patch superfamily enzyme
VVKGIIPDNSIVIGNPAKIIANTQEWAHNYTIEEQFLHYDKN